MEIVSKQLKTSDTGAGHGAEQCRFENTNKLFCYIYQTIEYHKNTERPQISSGSKDKRYKNNNFNKNSKSKSTHESVAKNKSQSKQKGFKTKRREN